MPQTIDPDPEVKAFQLPASDGFPNNPDLPLLLYRGAVEDTQTDIAKLYAWQTDGPFLRNFCGNEPAGRRDAGALERTL